MQTIEMRRQELKRIIEEAERELYNLEWAVKTSYQSGWGAPQQKVCCMPQGHPTHCGCNW